VEFQISVLDMRGAAAGTSKPPAETDCAVVAEDGHRVADLAAALARLGSDSAWIPGARDPAVPPELWAGGARLDPAAPLDRSGIRDGCLLGLGGRAPRASIPPPPGGLAEIRVVAGPDAGLVAPVGAGDVTIARDQGDVLLSDTNVSRRPHCVISISPAGPGSGDLSCSVRDAGSTNGTGLDGAAVGAEPVPLRPGQLIGIGSDLLTVALPPAETAVVQPGGPDDPLGLRLSRPPRPPAAPPEHVVIDLAAEPERSHDGTPSWLTLLIAPAVSLAVGAAVVALTRQWFFLLLGVGGVAVSLVTQISSRRSARARRRSAQRDFQEAATAGRQTLAGTLADEQLRLRAAAPDPAHLLRIASGPGARLWERMPSDDDFLHLRIGWADLPSAAVDLRGSPGQARAPEALVRDVPAVVPFKDVGVLGIAGPEDLGRATLAWAVAQLCVLHSPSDLSVVLLTDKPRAWRWARWLPHLAPLPGSAAQAGVGTDPESCAARADELWDLVQKRCKDAADVRRAGRRSLPPAVVVVLDGSYRLLDLPGLAWVLSEGPAVGVYTICRDDDRTQLSRDCDGEMLIGPGGRATYRGAGGPLPVTRLDLVGFDWCDRVARCLAPLRDGSAGRAATGGPASGMPATVRLLDLWGAGQPTAAQVADGWARLGRTTAVPLGQIAGAQPFVLDIAKDGPHMLVAGTTGAGKSEFLQALVSSLALGNRPDALVFVLIDFKGGSAFAGLSALPHVAGFLTDLDEHLTRRALVALEAEVKYRERVLRDARCKDIEAYHRAGEPLGPLPRLVLVVDEARFLVVEVPDFLEQLTDVTARGRSLGVHLVLATQRPAGVISEDIRTNMALRVCFRVEDAADSTAVVEFPDAAGIDRRLRGRGYARTERGAATLFQGAYVGGRHPGAPAALPTAHAQALTVAERPFAQLGAPASGAGAGTRADAGQTDLAALIAAVCETKQQAPEHRPWLDPLPSLIRADDLPFPAAARPPGLPAVGYGLEDRPVEQVQQVAALDLDHGGHLLVVGAPQSGRTTLLRTVAGGIARGHSPDDVHLYVLDCDAGGLAPLARLPHCGAVVRRSERERVSRLLNRLEAEISRRHELLSGSGFASVTEQRAAVPGPDRLPYLVLLLDRWEGFVAELGQVDSGRLPDQVYRLLSEGASAGLRVVATGDKTALSRLAGHFPARLVLRMTDVNDLILAGVPKNAMPQDPPPGRGIAVPGGTEVQVAFIGGDPDGVAQSAALDALIRSAAVLPPGRTRPLRVDVLPARVSHAQAVQLPGAPAGPLRPLVAVGGDELSRLGPDLARFPGFAIAGPPLSGRSTALLVMAESLLAAGTSVIAFAPRESPLRRLAGRAGVAAVFTAADGADPVGVQRLLEAATGPVAVLVDDAEALHQAPVGELLAQVPVEGRGRGHALVVAGASGELVRTARSFTAAARKFRCGLLLTPEAYQLGQELFGTTLPRSAAFDRPAGRGYLIGAGQAVLVQVPEPPAG